MTKVVIVGAGARGNKVFADLMGKHKTGFETAGVVEPDYPRRAAFQSRYGIPDECAFSSTAAFLEAPRFADIVFICTPDPTHYTLCRDISERGYDILLEKPIATNLPDCLALLDVEQTHNNRIFVAHVLRYSPFFRTIREVIRSGRLGGVRNLHLTENIGHWHFAHSYVRGNWRSAATSAPIILTKSSHDLDIIQWLLGQRALSVASYGNLDYFRRENAPPGAAERCVECPLQDTCLYSATRFYRHMKEGWPFEVIAPPPDQLEDRIEAIENGPYGRCVWQNDNDVADNQTVIMEFESGIHATFSLQGLTADNTRKITILFDKAELTGDLHRCEITISHFLGEKDRLEIEDVPLPENTDSHGGGDLALLYALHDYLTKGEHSEVVTSLRSSIASHVMAFLAEDSRLQDNEKLPVLDVLLPDSGNAQIPA